MFQHQINILECFLKLHYKLDQINLDMVSLRDFKNIFKKCNWCQTFELNFFFLCGGVVYVQ